MSTSSTTDEKAPHDSWEYNEEDEYADVELNYKPKSPKFWLIIGGIYAGVFLVGLDRLIIATAIPAITDDFHSIDDIGWYGSAYMLACAVVIPLSGRFYQLYPTKWVYLISLLIFEIGSALCGAAPNSVAFIIGRAIAGTGAASIFAGGIMIMIPMVPLSKRPAFTAFFGIAMALCSILGPLIGGAFTDNPHLTWRWCFYINLPIGGFTAAAILFFFNFPPKQREKLSVLGHLQRLDPLGLLFFVPSMVCLILALQWGGSTYAWSDAKIIGLLVCFGVCLVIFVVVEVLTPETAMAPMRVILQRSVAGSLVFMLLISGSLMTMLYFLSEWFQIAQQTSAEEAGIRTIPMMLSFTIFAIIVAVFTQGVGYYVPPMLLAPVFCAVGAGMLSTMTPSAGSNEWIGYQVIFGLGIGSGFQASTLAPQNVLPRADVPLGMAMIFFMQQLGGAVFIPVGQNIISSTLVSGLSGVPGVNPQAILNTGATALSSSVPADEVGTVRDTYSYALTRSFLLSAGIGAAMILGALPLEWKSIKKAKKPKQDAVEEGNVEVAAESREQDSASKT